jgi:quinol monooxygenase YgiN
MLTQIRILRRWVNKLRAEDLPEGWIFHAAGPTEDGWRVVEVWESQEAADAYFQGRLGQVLQNLCVSLGQPDTFKVYNIIAY